MTPMEKTLLFFCLANLLLTVHALDTRKRVAQEVVNNYRRFLIRMNPRRVKKGARY